MNARHRFTGKVGALCAWKEGGNVCALNYSASLHYNDDDHPYDAGEPAGGSCVWVLQNVVGGASGNLYCWRSPEDPVHLHPSDSVTVTFDPVVAEPPYPAGRVYGSSADAPMEADPVHDGVVDGTHSLFACGHPECVRDAEAAKVADGDLSPGRMVPFESRAAWAAKALRTSDVVATGPWPVRQWFAPDGGAPEWWENPGELICALNVTGEPFRVDVWWADEERRMVRVVWGGLLYLDDESLTAAVERWTT